MDLTTLSRAEKEQFDLLAHEAKLYNTDAEQLVLGCLLSNNEEYYKIGKLSKHHFFIALHQRIFNSIEQNIKHCKPANAVTLKNQFNADPELEGEKGAAYLAKLIGLSGVVLAVRDYSEILVELHYRRQLLYTITNFVSEINDPANYENSSDLQTRIFSQIMEVEIEDSNIQSYRIGEVVNEILEAQEHPLECYSTGISIIDEIYGGGLFIRRSYALAADSKQGKTTLMSTIYYNMIKAGLPILYITLEMGRHQLTEISLAREIGINSNDMPKQHGQSELIDGIFKAKPTMSNMKGYFVDGVGMTITEIKQTVELHVKRYGIKGFFLDHITRVRKDNNRETTEEFLDRLCQWLADITKKHDIFSYYASQVNAEGNTHRSRGPQMNCDQLHTLHAVRDKRMAYMTVKVARYGEWLSAGNQDSPGLRWHSNGPHFKDVDAYADEEMQF